MSKTIMIDGSNPSYGETILTDHTTTEFRLLIRTIDGQVGPETIKNLIQQKFEVVDIEQTDKTHFGRSPQTRDFIS